MTDSTRSTEVRELTHRTLEELHITGPEAELVRNRLVERLPFPLYDLKMRLITVKKSELREIQARWYPEL